MKEWFVYLVCGGCTAVGVLQVASASYLSGPFWGSLVLFLIFSLHYLNTRLAG